MRRATLSLVVAFCLALVPAAWAHHSQSEFDLRAKVEVEGTVTKVDWRSPHAWIYVDVTDDKGQKVNTTLMRRGWARDSLKPGDRIRVAGAPARNHPAIAIATSIKDGNGKPFFTGTTQIVEPESPNKATKPSQP